MTTAMEWTDRISFHPLPQIAQQLVKGIHPNKPEPGEFQVEDDIHRDRQNQGKADHVNPTARLAPAMA